MLQATETIQSVRWDEREKLALLGLWAVPGLGPITAWRLRSWAGGTFAGLLETDPAQWRDDPQLALPSSLRAELQTFTSVAASGEKVHKRAAAANMKIAFWGERAYPPRLMTGVPDAPPVLFYRGEVDVPVRPRVAMVGTRHPRSSFAERTEAFAEKLAQSGVGIVSGAAFGIDTAAHMGAVKAGGETWAFVGSSLDELDALPRQLQGQILGKGGALFSEYPPNVRADKFTFPRRNRLISGASDVTVVMRAADNSGSLHTARYALEQGRTLMAVPGDLDSAEARGCNALIVQGAAKAALSPSMVLKELGIAAPLPMQRLVRSVDGLSDKAQRAYRALTYARPFEELEAELGFTSGELIAAMVELELSGLVQQRTGKRYEKV